eukprot:4371856-Alexandrium_andersonii.AAC.1
MVALQHGTARLCVRDPGDCGSHNLALRLVLVGEVVRRGRRSTGLGPAAGHELRAGSEQILAVRARGLRRCRLDGLGEA